MTKKKLMKMAEDFELNEHGGLSDWYITGHFKELLVKFVMKVIVDLQTKVNTLQRELRHEKHLRQYWHDEYVKLVDKED